MVRFIQTSDWQIGMKGGGLAKAASLVRNTRIKSIRNVLDAALDHNADFILLCGDIFEHNQVGRGEIEKVVRIFNEYPEIPLYLLPGNHDIIGPDCIYKRNIFKAAEHLTILDSNNPVDIAGATLYPCPVLSKFSIKDFTESIPDVYNTPGIHIGAGHGSLVGKFKAKDWENIQLPIDPLRVDKTGLDYLALGHWHGFRQYPDMEGIDRIVYSGTHEQTNYEEVEAGGCLVVEIDKKRAKPSIKRVKVGRLSWKSEVFELKDELSLTELSEILKTLKEFDLLKLTLRGMLPLDSKKELESLLEIQNTYHKDFRARMKELLFSVPTDAASHIELGDPTLNEVESNLRELYSQENEGWKKRIILKSITTLRRLSMEGME